MAISFAEVVDLQCPSCSTPFQTETWVVVDGAERPDLVRRILDGSLHDTSCPNCGQRGAIPAPVLYHDGRARRVLLAVPSVMAEAEWQEAGQSLLWMLVGALPEADRASYLGELQAEAELTGIAAVIRAEGLAGTSLAPVGEEAPPLVQAIQALLNAQGHDALQRVLQEHRVLLEPQTVMVLRELANEAFKQQESEAGRGFGRAADILNELRSAQTVTPPAQQSPPAVASVADDPVEELAFLLLRSHTAEALGAAVDEHPELLEAETEALLDAWAVRARAEGKHRIADGIDERIGILRLMRERYETERPVYDAVQAFLEASTSDSVEATLVEYDSLWTDEADQVLERLAQTADDDFRALVEERRTLLHRIRSALVEQERVDPSDADS